MGFPTQTMQEVIDITKAFEEAIKNLKLPKDYNVYGAQITLMLKKNIVSTSYVNVENNNYSSHIDLQR